MAIDKALRDHAKLFAKDVKAGKATANTDQARDFMEEHPDAVLGMIGLIQQAASRKRPNQALSHQEPLPVQRVRGLSRLKPAKLLGEF